MAFTIVKERLTEDPVLPLTVDELMYVLDTDAFGESIGAVVSQI